MTLSNSSKVLLVVGMIMAGLAVVIGAFGAHGLSMMITEVSKGSTDVEAINRHAKRLANWDTGSTYQMYHAFGLIVAGLICNRSNQKFCTIAGWLFLTGIVLFSGSLYAITLSGQTWPGRIAPLGGSAFIIGWILLAIAVGKGVEPESAQ